MQKEKLVEFLDRVSDVIIENKEYLNDLDRAIGDADHGINMARGFIQVKDKLKTIRDEDCGFVLKVVAMTLISTVGGASGPLYGTAFLKAASVVNGKDEISRIDLVKMYEEIIDGIMSRGKAEKGCKTMLDAIIPAYDAYKEAIDGGESLKTALKSSETAALEGVEYTKTIIATRGRASYLGERSIGHADPGATSSYLIIKTLSDMASDI